MQAVITTGHNVAVRAAEIPPHEGKYLASETLRAVERYFKIPGVQEDYQKWLKEYRKRKAAKQ